MKTVFLDAATLAPAGLSHFSEWDIQLDAINALDLDLIWHYQTTPEERLSHIGDAEVIITNKVVIDQPVISACPKLKLICVAATGVNNIDLEAAKAANIRVCNVVNYSTASVVQTTFYLLFGLMFGQSRLIDEQATQAWAKQPLFSLLSTPFEELAGKHLLLIGYGNIGQAVAEVAKAFGMQVSIAQIPGRPERSHYVSLEAGLAQADVVSLHCPQSELTEGLVDETFLSRMKSSAFLINTARGGLLNEIALLDALQNKRIAGAGVDVLSQEPPPLDHPLVSYQGDNFILTPHIGWASQQARQRLLDGIARNIDDYVNGKLVQPVV